MFHVFNVFNLFLCCNLAVGLQCICFNKPIIIIITRAWTTKSGGNKKFTSGESLCFFQHATVIFSFILEENWAPGKVFHD